MPAKKPKPAGKRPVGRPSHYTDALAAKVCDLIAMGRSLRQIAREPGMPATRSIMRWLDKHDEFRRQYARAREVQADFLADQILDIADDSSNDWIERDGKMVLNREAIDRARVRIDARKWMAAKMAPKRYGDKADVQVSGEVGLTGLGPLVAAAEQIIAAGKKAPPDTST